MDAFWVLLFTTIFIAVTFAVGLNMNDDFGDPEDSRHPSFF
ncbi:hypothetical protein ACWODI_03110 [Facklamia languida]|uniref:Uncharacterized protein n=1 Tax=Facklamia languida CCUG 37842 TaxID=883113 RepID=H3NK28_9LACT|nr:hypothetical protein [Facklamia languida]EHR36545.1 hypothetical protein HMPREF9708_01217 [Facklamia languida CCUG 37842]